ncbi:MAG: glycosyltransferase [Bryobacteraceae bacterium]|nr:glycosyltransferase [Bryobacteraceae bacterium]
MKPTLLRVLRQLPLAALSVVFMPLAWALLWAADALFLLFGKRQPRADSMPRRHAASVVIPNWNGRDLLEKYLPPLVRAMSGHPDNEIIVVDNGSTDGSAAFVREHFPEIRLLALPENLGFGGGSNAGFRAAKNDIVVLLNSDMRVAEDFLEPLLEGFTDPQVFAVSCQIFFSDPQKRREETGLTQGWWSHGMLRVRHREDDAVDRLFPCFYGGGGSCAFDRRKFLELGGFDPLLHPFYLEDTDLGYLAWKRGWKVMYQPKSRVWHEHRGTIGRTFGRGYIENVIRRNFVLFAWKNMHEPGRVAGHFLNAWAGAMASWLGGESLERASLPALWGAFLRLPQALRSRWRARRLAEVSDTEAFRRPMGGWFRDRFETSPPSDPPRVLMVAPYAICPPVHGGGVFMYHAARELARHAELHLLVMVDAAHEIAAHEPLRDRLRSMHFVVRREGKTKGAGSITPYAVREFADPELEWLLHRQIFLEGIDVVQLEYTQMAQYAGRSRRLVWALFEHDIYFQSIGRAMKGMGLLQWVSAGFEYLRALHWELRTLPRLDAIQTCTAENTEYLLSFLHGLDGRVRHDLRAGIDVSSYKFRPGGRLPRTILFLGSFRHRPNLEALDWLIRRVMPQVLEQEPQARLYVAGSDPPAGHTIPDLGGAVEVVGFVPDVREALARYAVFACPILSGSGVRVKLLEAFASGIPCVSTTLGAEGLARNDGDVCLLADDPGEFARKIVALFRQPALGEELARRARAYVEQHHDAARMARKLVESYREHLARKAGAAEPVATKTR